MTSSLNRALDQLVKGRFLIPSAAKNAKKSLQKFEFGPNSQKLEDNLMKKILVFEEEINPERKSCLKKFSVETGDKKAKIYPESSSLLIQNKFLSKVGNGPAVSNEIRKRRSLWKGYFNNPWSLKSTRGEGEDGNSVNVFAWNSSDDQADLGLLEDVHFEKFSSTPNFTDIKVETDISAVLISLLLDGFRERAFMTDSTRIALHPELAPYQTSFMIKCSSKDSQKYLDLLKLKDYIRNELGKSEISILEGEENSNVGDIFNRTDDAGVPTVLILNEQTLVDGIVFIHDRSTTWFEQIHLSGLFTKLNLYFGKKVSKAELKSEN